MSARDHLSRIHELKCVVCKHMGMQQATRTEAHHPESIRDETSDYGSVAICGDHHTGPNGIHGLSRRAFEMRYKLTEVDLIALTIREMDRQGLFTH